MEIISLLEAEVVGGWHFNSERNSEERCVWVRQVRECLCLREDFMIPGPAGDNILPWSCRET